MNSDDTCGSVALPSPYHFVPHHAIGRLLERLSKATPSPEATGFAKAQAGLETHACARSYGDRVCLCGESTEGSDWEILFLCSRIGV